ncbi:DUF554 family protein [Actinomyces radicidentis]|uniref:DUF554 family protein n=1 Tax=Actinomyces radicidentis TaxID=111015 RepID=UPI003AA95DE3
MRLRGHPGRPLPGLLHGDGDAHQAAHDAGGTGNLSLVGSILIFCVGLNLLRPGTVRVANLLPAILIAPALAFTPWGL